MSSPPETSDLVTDTAAQLPSWHVPGLQLAVVREGRTLLAGGVGDRRVDAPSPVGPSTLFHHGSCGKAYTSLLVALLAGEGLLDLDAPIRQWVPELSLPDPRVAEQLTLRDVLSHRGGLGRHDLAWLLHPSWSPDDLLGRLAHLPLTGTFRQEMEYTNLGYALAGIVLSRATGRSWAELLSARVLAPLGMTRTTTSSRDAVQDPDHAVAHVRVAGHVVRTDHRDLGVVAPAGQLLSCASDAVSWLTLHLGAAHSPADLAAAADLCHQPAVALPHGIALGEEHPLSSYGFGWVIGSFRGTPMLWHSGGIDGFMTQVLLVPERGLGVLASANLNGTGLPLAVVLHLADHLLHHDEGPAWFERLRQEDEDPPLLSESHQYGESREGASLAGTYRHDGYGDLVLDLDGSGLSARLGECALEARPDDEGWRVRYAPLDDDLGPLVVERDDTGTVTAVSLAVDAAAGAVPFRRVEPAGT